jgi:hypothetical protein
VLGDDHPNTLASADDVAADLLVLGPVGTSRVSLLSFGMRGWNAVVWQVVPLSDKDGSCALAEKAACQVGRAGS